VFGKVEDDDVISFLELLIQLPLAPFSLDLRRTGHFDSVGEGGEKRGDEEKSRNGGLETHLWAKPWVTRKVERVQDSGTIRYTGSPRPTTILTKKRRSHFGLHDHCTGHVAQPIMYISRFQTRGGRRARDPLRRVARTIQADKDGGGAFWWVTASDGNVGPEQECGRRFGQSDGGVAYRDISCNHTPNA